MSDILIKGLEMPKKNARRLVLYPNGIVSLLNLYNEKSDDVAFAEELPPHGDLVNLDDVYEAINREIVPKGIFLSDFYKAFADIPVVLERTT